MNLCVHRLKLQFQFPFISINILYMRSFRSNQGSNVDHFHKEVIWRTSYHLNPGSRKIFYLSRKSYILNMYATFLLNISDKKWFVTLLAKVIHDRPQVSMYVNFIFISKKSVSL